MRDPPARRRAAAGERGVSRTQDSCRPLRPLSRASGPPCAISTRSALSEWSNLASTSGQIALYRAVHEAGDMTVRTDVFYRAFWKADVEKGIAAIKAQTNNDMLRFVGIKFPLDGGVEGGRTFPYRLVPGEQTDPDYRGVLLLPPGGEDDMSRARS